MKTFFNLFLVLSISVNLSFCQNDDILELSNQEQSTMIDLIVENSNIDSMRGEDGLVYISDFISLLSIKKANEPSILLSEYIVNTYSMKFLLIPLIVDTDRELFRESLNSAFESGLNVFKDEVIAGDIQSFCENPQESLILKFGITVRKDYLNEDKELLFSNTISPESCKS